MGDGAQQCSRGSRRSLSKGSRRAPSTCQIQIGPGVPAFTIVGLPDKAVAESRERVRGALNAIGLGLPPKRITVNLAPADLPKEGSHYDLPMALGLMPAVGAVTRDAIEGSTACSESLRSTARSRPSPTLFLSPQHKACPMPGSGRLETTPAQNVSLRLGVLGLRRFAEASRVTEDAVDIAVRLGTALAA